MQQRLMTRAEVPAEETWNLGDLFPTAEAWEEALAAVEADIPTVTQYQGRLGEGPAVLKACLDADEALSERLIRVATYATLRNSEDGSNPANQAAYARVAALSARFNAALSFVESELLALPEGTIERYLATEPGLANFRTFLTDLLEKKPHMLSPETEVALASLGEVLGSPYVTYNRGKMSDMKFDPVTDGEGREVPVSFNLYEGNYEVAADTTLRRNAFRSFAKGLEAYKNTFAATFAAEVKKNVVMAKLRKYKNATEMLLQPHKIPFAVYENLLNVIQAELAPHMQRYARLRRRVLGLDELYYCDIKAPLDPGYNPQVSFQEAAEMILDALQIMGTEYCDVMQRALRERWVDLANNVGKSTGAFCSSPYGVHPYILITWTNTMRDVLVLAHELGHAGHFALAQRYQTLTNTRPTMFFIEAPSTINELLLGQHIMARSGDPRMRRWVIMQFLATYHHNFITHLLEGELQRRIYALAEEGQPITANTLCETKGAILQSFWGETVEIDDAARLTWMRQPHYYMGLYPYTYSAGLTCATAVAQMIREEGQPAVDRWLQVLKAGGTMRPLELMKLAGVDMTTAEPIRKAVAYVGSLVDELEKSF